MVKTIKSACPRDYQGCCAIVAIVDEPGFFVKAQGDPNLLVSWSKEWKR